MNINLPDLNAQPFIAQLVLIVIGAYLTGKVGGALLGLAIRRTVVRLKTDKNKDDLRKRQDTLDSIFGTLFRVLVWFIATIVMLRALNVDLAPLLAGVSVIGVALGFGTQSLVKDILAGTFIILENQYRVGDTVNLDGSEGQVEQISLRSTTLRDDDGNVHRIPNGSVQRVVNRTMGFSNINLKIAVPSDANLNKVTKLVNLTGEALADDESWQEKLLSTPKFLSIGALSGGTLEVKVSARTLPTHKNAVSAELRKRLMAAFVKSDIEVSEISETSSGK